MAVRTTVKELIATLSAFDPDLPVYVEDYLGTGPLSGVDVYDAWEKRPSSDEIETVGNPRGDVFKVVIIA